MTYLSSAWYRNGEDIIFYEPEFHDLAHQIATGEHSYQFEISVLGWHLFFTTATHKLEILYSYEDSGKYGTGKLTLYNIVQ
jgi:hypothetical protein